MEAGLARYEHNYGMSGARLGLLSLGISLSVASAVWGASHAEKKAPPTTEVLTATPLGQRFRLFYDLAIPPPRTPFGEGVTSEKRLFHTAGDPDSLFTFGGGPTPRGALHLRAAFEVNDVVLHSIAPDPRVDPSDTRPRSSGDYRALDASGRPYQLRLGARLVW